MHGCARFGSSSGPLDVIDVDWSSLMPKQKQEPRAPGAALLRFTPGAVLLRAGVSRRLAGPQLLARVKEVCKGELDDPKGELMEGCWLEQIVFKRLPEEQVFFVSWTYSYLLHCS